MAAIFEIKDTFDTAVTSSCLERIDSNCDYNAFFQLYIRSNIPCIISNIGCNWMASKYWTNSDEPNFAYLLEKYGNSVVTIYDCNKRHYNSQKTEKSTLKHYIENWSDMKRKLYYVKDWHLQNEFPYDCFYEVPIFFASDWLNEFLCENGEDDYRFVYIGPMGTWTPFHADVFTSYSWSINICGQKRWLLFPPGEENKLKDNLGNLPYNLEHSSLQEYRYFELIQNTNEAIFIPSGWHHQVWNMKDTISINHNWINGCNVKNMWQSLEQNLTAVEKEIEDCQDMDNFEEHCQIVLKASYGLDFATFYEFLKYIAVKRIDFLQNNKKIICFGKYEMGMAHALFDLRSIRYVLELFLDKLASKNLGINETCSCSDSLLNSICECIDNKI